MQLELRSPTGLCGHNKQPKRGEGSRRIFSGYKRERPPSLLAYAVSLLVSGVGLFLTSVRFVASEKFTVNSSGKQPTVSAGAPDFGRPPRRAPR